MRKLSILIQLFVSFCVMSGCVTDKYIKKTPSQPPYEPKKEISIQDKNNLYQSTQISKTSEQKPDHEKDIERRLPPIQKIHIAENKKEIQNGLNLLSQKKCDEAIDLFSSLTIRHPEETRIQYYLSLAYDKCGNIREALDGYTEYINLQSDDNVLKRKSKIRLQEIKDEVAEKLIEKSQRLADDHNYEHCLKRLEQAYSLFPSKVIVNKIIERYTSYSIESIAWDLSAQSNLIKEKTVFVIPFSCFSGIENDQGKAIAGEIRNELINLQAIEVYVRDDDSIKEILKEIEFSQSSGAIDEKTRKDLGKLVSTGAIVSGSIG